MKKAVLILIAGIFLIGCSSKEPVKQNPSFETQKQDAKSAWRELDNQ